MIFYVVVVLISVWVGFIIHALLSAPTIADLRARVGELESEFEAWGIQ